MSWGLIIIVIGVLFLLDNLRVLDFGDVVSDYWPLILVIVGLRMILFRKRADETPEQPSGASYIGPPSSGSGNSSREQRISESKLIGDTTLKVTSDDFLGGNVSSFIGDDYLDLSEVSVKTGEKVVHLSGFIGDVKINAPKKVPFMLTANATIGDIRIFENKYEGLVQSKTYKSPDYDAATARLRIHVTKFIGDVTCW
jgi:predicted membrane protein